MIESVIEPNRDICPYLVMGMPCIHVFVRLKFEVSINKYGNSKLKAKPLMFAAIVP